MLPSKDAGKKTKTVENNTIAIQPHKKGNFSWGILWSSRSYLPQAGPEIFSHSTSGCSTEIGPISPGRESQFSKRHFLTVVNEVMLMFLSVLFDYS